MDLTPVHANQDELMYLDILQEGPSFDDELKIREYSKLEPLFSSEEFITMMMGVLEQIQESGDLDQQFVRLREALDNEPIEFVDAPGDSNPEIQNLAELGENGGDDRIALFPPSVIDVFKDIVGDKKNPQTGMYQFFFPILAAILAGSAASAAGAGVIGTALATGAGSFAGSKLMGAKTGDAFKNAALSGLTAGIMPTVASGFASAFPEATGVLSKMSNALLGPGASGAIGAALTGSGPAYSEAAKAAAGTAGSTLGQAAASGLGETASKGLLGGNLPLLALGGGYLFSKAKEQEKDYEKQKKDFEDSLNKSSFLNITPYEGTKYKSKYKPSTRDLTLYNPSGRLNYKAGGLVAGSDKGQKDNRPYKLKEGSYVVNATNLADLGDGNSAAGNKELNRFLSKIKSMNDGHTKTIDALLSDGEHIIDRAKVNAIGNGSNEVGAKLLDEAFKKLRRQKTSNGLELPPPAFKLEKYLYT